jgi:endonuclease/exonuclease/phosphatase family metal-dependent hydrolase
MPLRPARRRRPGYRRAAPVIPRSLELDPLIFAAGRWAPTPTPAREPPRALRVLTWNVWFGGHMFDERAAALLAELGRRQPDVVLLQEVTPELLATITLTPWVRARYALSDARGGTLGGYGVLLLSRQPVRRMTQLELPSRMGRSLLVAELACGLTVATVHLESTDPCDAERAAQLRIVQPHLAALSPDVLLAGDMNFTPDHPLENAALDPSFVDVWPALHADPGYTVDTDVNTMRYQVRARRTQKRIDRVFLRSAAWRADAIHIVGTSPIDELGTFVSDHFGLEARLEARASTPGV